MQCYGRPACDVKKIAMDCGKLAIGPGTIFSTQIKTEVHAWKARKCWQLVGGFVDEELLARNEYLAAENEILRSKMQEPIRLNDEERIRLAEIGRRIGLKALKDVSTIVKPETVMEWFRKLVAGKFDGSGKRNPSGSGRPKIDPDIEAQALKMARENPSWGYRIAGALRNLGYDIIDRTVGNILKRNGVPPAPKRRPDISWNEFVESHKRVPAACDFFTTEVLTPAGLITFFVLFFIKIGSREVQIAGVTTSPDEKWMKQIARNIAMADWGFLSDCKYLIHDRDSKFCLSFRKILKEAGLKLIRLPPKSPDLNAYAERFVRSVKSECLSRLIIFGENGLRHALEEYLIHYHQERNHQGLANAIPFPNERNNPGSLRGRIVCRKRLGGFLKFYCREAV